MVSALVTAGISTAAAIATAVYSTGGRGALERRAIRQELEVAALLPDSGERDAMQQAARDRAVIYVARRLGQEPYTARQHAVLLGFAAGSLVIAYAGAMLSRMISNRTPILTVLDSLALLMMIMGFTLAAAAFTAWCSGVFIAQRTRNRRLAVASHRQKIAEHVARRSEFSRGRPAGGAASVSGRRGPSHQ